MLTRTRPSSQTYQVGTDTGWPSGRTVAITAGLGWARNWSIFAGTGGLAIGAPLLAPRAGLDLRVGTILAGPGDDGRPGRGGGRAGGRATEQGAGWRRTAPGRRRRSGM